MSKYSEKFKLWKGKKKPTDDAKESSEVEGTIEIKRGADDFQAQLEQQLSGAKKDTPEQHKEEHKEGKKEPHHFHFPSFHRKPKKTAWMEQHEQKWENLKENADKFGHLKKELTEKEKKKKLTKDAVEEKKKAIKKDVFKALKKKTHAPVSRRKQLRFFLNRAGYEDLDDIKLKKTVLFKIPIITLSVLSIIVLAAALTTDSVPILYAIFFIIVGLWVLGYALILILEFTAIYLYLDSRTYRRKKELELVLADFLQLTSSNISAGMPIDRALWFAVRPKFGVLAKEIEEVAKATLTGEDLSKALKNFTAKFDSVILNRSINLLLEGMQGGGEIADLLNKIALNIQEIRIMKKQMAADVLTYVIFITFASIVIAPFLFALSTQLLTVVVNILGSLGESTSISSFSISGKATLNPTDFKWFVIAMLTIGSTISAFIIATIQKGVPREGLKKIPGFIAVSITLYLLGNWIFGNMMAAMF